MELERVVRWEVRIVWHSCGGVKGLEERGEAGRGGVAGSGHGTIGAFSAGDARSD